MLRVCMPVGATDTLKTVKLYKRVLTLFGIAKRRMYGHITSVKVATGWRFGACIGHTFVCQQIDNGQNAD